MESLLKRGYQSFVRLDSGGQANVYKTLKHDRYYAIKVVRVENPNSNKLDEDLARELAIVRNLRHPNCIHVEEIFRTRGKIYIIMDYMPNGTIGNVVRKNTGGLCEWNAKLWFCPVALALRYLHSHRIAHRDLKLDNVLLDAHLNPVLTDYGFSRFVTFDAAGQVIPSNTYCGTTSYNPPEILKQIPYDPFRGDIWCLGVALFIMINHIYPFDRRDQSKMYANQLARNYHLQPSVEQRISNELKHLIDILLEPTPSKRPSIKDVCGHIWFPIIHEEGQRLKAAAAAAVVN